MAKQQQRKAGKDILIRSAELIGWALGGLEREILETRKRLDALTKQAAELRQQLGRRQRSSRTLTAGVDDGGRGPAAAPSFNEPGVTGEKPRRRRTMSAAARKRISERQKKRWADWRKKQSAEKSEE